MNILAGLKVKRKRKEKNCEIVGEADPRIERFEDLSPFLGARAMITKRFRSQHSY